MQRLEREISRDDNIELSIATRYRGKDQNRVVKGRTTYYLIPDKRGLLRKRIDILLNREPIDELVKQYIDIINEIQPDIVHIFGTEMEYGLVSALTNVPVVIHIQGILLPCYYHLTKIHVPNHKKLLSASVIDWIKGNTIRNSMRVFQRRVRIEERIFSACRYFVGRTTWDQQMVKLFAPHARYFHCDEMLRDDFFEKSWTCNDDETIHIVSTISSPLYKGHETIVAASLALKNANIKFIWHIIGLNKKSAPYRIFYKANMKKLSNNILLHGELKAREMIPVLQHANVYVHPSHIENSSNGICEAMALGMPVIALYTGGNASMIENKVDGILVPDNDPFSLAVTIKETSINRAASRNMGDHAKNKAATRHDPARIVDELMKIYQNVIDIHENQG